MFRPFRAVAGDAAWGRSACLRQPRLLPRETLLFLFAHTCSPSSFHGFFLSRATRDPLLLAQRRSQSEAPIPHLILISYSS